MGPQLMRSEAKRASPSCWFEFGFEGDVETPPPFELGEGVLLRGRIDRVDVGVGGEAVVYDYKSRSAPPSAKWLGDGIPVVEKSYGHLSPSAGNINRLTAKVA